MRSLSYWVSIWRGVFLSTFARSIFARRFFCPQIFLPTDFFAYRFFCLQIFLPADLFACRSFCLQEVLDCQRVQYIGGSKRRPKMVHLFLSTGDRIACLKVWWAPWIPCKSPPFRYDTVSTLARGIVLNAARSFLSINLVNSYGTWQIQVQHKWFGRSEQLPDPINAG